MSKNKNKGRGKEDATASVEVATAVKAPRKPRGPMDPLPIRLCVKADKVLSLAKEMAHDLSSRGAPTAAREAAAAFVEQVDSWRNVFVGLKEAGWEPDTVGAKTPIVEGDPIKILDEHLDRYAFIEGLLDGSTLLVAGAVEQVNRMLVQVMLKDTSGKFYGYAPRQFLAKR